MYYIEPYHTSLSAHLHGVCYAQYGRSSPFLLFIYSALSFWLCCPSHTCCCGKCEKDDMKCPGKEYQSTNVLYMSTARTCIWDWMQPLCSAWYLPRSLIHWSKAVALLPHFVIAQNRLRCADSMKPSVRQAHFVECLSPLQQQTTLCLAM